VGSLEGEGECGRREGHNVRSGDGAEDDKIKVVIREESRTLGV
jgi:hypothetical protein